jgi:GNAT superfamily N-acetyltransferase
VVPFLQGREASRVTIAVSATDPDQIFGYIVSEPGVVHYLFVKETFRRMGIGKALLTSALDDDCEFIYTFRTPVCRQLPDTYVGTYNPNHVRRKPSNERAIH